MEKVILISIDGMRPDGLMNCGNSYINELMKESSYTLKGTTVHPSVTLPCHMSMFHSVTPQRHGILTNTYTPQVRPINGIFEQVKAAGGSSAMFYGWEQLRDIGKPGSLKYSIYRHWNSNTDNDEYLTDCAVKYIEEKEPEFVFLYLVDTDEAGHSHSWMSETYLKTIGTAIDCVKRVVEKFGEKYTIIITADHGGHEQTHGTEMPEDMTIPLFFRGKDFEQGKELENVNIIDIAPTIAKVMGINCDEYWTGKVIK